MKSDFQGSDFLLYEEFTTHNIYRDQSLQLFKNRRLTIHKF